MQWPSPGYAARNLAADQVKMYFEVLGGWEAIAAIALAKGLMPRNSLERFAAFCILSYCGAVAQLNLPEDTLIGKVLKELLSDMASELGKRFGNPPKNAEQAIEFLRVHRKELYALYA